MDYQVIIEDLFNKKTTFSNCVFSTSPGIYGIYFNGDEFPDAELKLTKGQLIYIGKSESSQLSRDKETHFRSGKTGSSTLRRTLGALLREELELLPIPRNSNDVKKGRITFYKFNDYSEQRLTLWMVENLSISYYEYPQSPKAIDFLETQMINLAKPIFNLAKNSTNPFSVYIKAKRKACGLIAHGLNQQTSHNHDSFQAQEIVAVNNNLRSKNNYKLHEAMEIVLKDRFKCRATIHWISDEIAKLDLYRKKDGGYASSGQIKLRAKNYPQFEIDGDNIILVKK